MNTVNSIATTTSEMVPSPPLMLLSVLRRAASLLKRDPNAAMIFVELASQLLEAEDGTALGYTKRKLLPWQARKVGSHIERNLHRPLRVNELAAIVEQSSSHFARAFKNTFGNTPHAYIRERRMERAEGMLRDGSESLCDIAIDCGLADQAHFCRVFRQYTGTTPGAWRRRHLAGPQQL
jgi:AraC family transcriptional regulator